MNCFKNIITNILGLIFWGFAVKDATTPEPSISFIGSLVVIGGGGGTASGTFTNCQGGGSSFGHGGTASGTFNNCQGGDYSFGGNGGTASGTFTNCTGGDSSFGGNGGTASGKLYYCRLTSGTFKTVSSGGRTVLCIDGNNNQNNQ